MKLHSSADGGPPIEIDVMVFPVATIETGLAARRAPFSMAVRVAVNHRRSRDHLAHCLSSHLLGEGDRAARLR